MRSRALCLVLLAFTATGCSALRLEVGVGTGIGAKVKVPYLYNGGLLTPALEWRAGHNYAEGWHSAHDGEDPADRARYDYDVALVLASAEARGNDHSAWSRSWLDPLVEDRDRSDLDAVQRTFSLLPIGWHAEQPSSHALELNLHLLVSVHVGFNPYFLYTPTDAREHSQRPGLREGRTIPARAPGD